MSGRVRKVEIRHFRYIESFEWFPGDGINCLIGPGDTGKSTVLDAIDLCLGARRNVQFTDSDFFNLDVSTPIKIAVTVGQLDDAMMSMDDYGLFLRGYEAAGNVLLPEPEAKAEVVLTIQLAVEADLEPVWTLYSERASLQGVVRSLSWADRLKIAPMRIGSLADHNLSWRRGSILHRVSKERADTLDILASATREMRKAFGATANAQVKQALEIVQTTASKLGVPVGQVSALLDPDSVSFSSGTIALHNGSGIPLRELGLGSVRLLLTGLQRHAAGQSRIVLLDEIEHGLEPHRIIRLITSLGAKEPSPPLQAFVTTHSPVALREMSADQLYVLRRNQAGHHEARRIGVHKDMQATVRACPDAFLAPSVIVCEGASEIGLVRGLDQHRVAQDKPSITALGVALADGHGDNTYRRANALAELGYRTLVLRDDDKQPSDADENKFAAANGVVTKWRNGRSLEEELFHSLSEKAVQQMLEAAVEAIGADPVDRHISSTDSSLDLGKCRAGATAVIRSCLGKAASKRKPAWFKNITTMETVALHIVGPDLEAPDVDPGFVQIVNGLFTWIRNAQQL